MNGNGTGARWVVNTGGEQTNSATLVGLTDGFEHHLNPTAVDYERVLLSGLVVVDTNVLLNLYRYDHRTRDDMLSVFRGLGDRLFIPHHVAAEFWRCRRAVIREAHGLANQFAGQLRTKRDDAMGVLNQWANRVALPAEDAAKSRHAIRSAYDEAIGAILSVKPVTPTSGVEDTSQDVILHDLIATLKGRVGQAPTTHEEAADLVEARKRLDEKRPPGYLDHAKSGDRAGGDYLVWVQTLREASRRSAETLFVTGDRKEDWWEIIGGKATGPRGELQIEHLEQTGTRLMMTTPDGLLLRAREALSLTIPEESVATARTVSRPRSGEPALARLEKLPDGRSGDYTQILAQMTQIALECNDLEDLVPAFQRAFPMISRPDVARRRLNTLVAIGLVEIDADGVTVTPDGARFANGQDADLLRSLFLRNVDGAQEVVRLASGPGGEAEVRDRLEADGLLGLSPTQVRLILRFAKQLGILHRSSEASTGPRSAIEAPVSPPASPGTPNQH